MKKLLIHFVNVIGVIWIMVDDHWGMTQATLIINLGAAKRRGKSITPRAIFLSIVFLHFVVYASLILDGLPFHASKEFHHNHRSGLQRHNNNNILPCLVSEGLGTTNRFTLQNRTSHRTMPLACLG